MKPLQETDDNEKSIRPPESILLTEIPLSGSGENDILANGVTKNDKLITGNGEKTCQDFDEVLEVVGSEGKFQKFLLYAVLCPIVTVYPFLELSSVFLWDIPDHFCAVPGRQPNVSLEQWKNLTLPWEKGPDGLMRHSQCKMIDQSTGNETQCQFGWEYDKTDYDSTIPSEYNWVCEKDHYATDCFTWGSVGTAIGTIVFGIMADKYGRKPMFFLACFTSVLLKTISHFLAHEYMIYKGLQLLSGIPLSATFNMPALICAEVSGTTYRSWIYAVTWMIWVLGNSLIPLVAMICRNWFLFGCVAYAPGLLLLLYFPFVDESPRWLVSAGRTDHAVSVCLKIAQKNGKTVNPQEIDGMVKTLVEKIKNEDKNQNLLSLFTKYRLAKNTIMLIIAWTMNSFLYYGLTLNSMHMAGNRFLNYFLLSIIELPGGWLAGKLVEKTGRRWTQAAFFCLCTLSCLICAVAVSYPGLSAIVVLGALGIKFGVTVTFMVVYLQGCEIFPTKLRSSGSSLASFMASAFGTIGPYIVYSGTFHVSFPYFLLCLCSFLGVVSSSLIPETFKQHLPETLEDANKFGKGHKFWSYLPQTHEKSKTSQEQTHKAE